MLTKHLETAKYCRRKAIEPANLEGQYRTSYKRSSLQIGIMGSCHYILDIYSESSSGTKNPLRTW